LFGALLAAALAVPCLAADPSAPTVRIAAGMLAGASADGVQRFLGIPYAAPPVGALRWQPPLPPASWSGVRQASAFGPACPQPEIRAFGNIPGPQSEDCLYLNVWAPASAATDRLRPVMVWLYGGAHRIGAASLPYYDGTSLARRGVVLVSFNYRLGYLGYFAHPALGTDGGGNFGLLDEIAALKWVQANIAAFGGDPKNVTIFGESAGGADVLYLMTSPAVHGLFLRAIVESGGGWYAPLSRKAMIRKVRADLRKAGIPDDIDARALRKLGAQKLIEAQQGDRSFGFGPFLDGRTVDEAPYVVFAKGQEAAVPLIVGSNGWEANLLKFRSVGLIGRVLSYLPPFVFWYQDRAQHGQAHDHRHQAGGQEVAVAEYPEVEDRFARGGQRIRDEATQRQCRGEGGQKDETRGEPVVLVAAVEHQLGPTDRDGDQRQSDPVHAPRAPLGIGAAAQNQPQRSHAHQQIDEERPTPGQRVGQPAPKAGAQDRAQHDAHRSDGHGMAALVRRISVGEDGLRQRHQGRAEGALQQAEQDDLRQILGQAAEHGGGHEADDGDGEIAAPAEAIAEIAGQGHHDRRRDQIAGQHPTDLVAAGAQLALHVRQRDVDDGGVQRLHDGRGHDRHRQQQTPALRHRRCGRRGACARAVSLRHRWSPCLRSRPAADNADRDR
jgi:acetyl esterase/lipase